MMPLFMAAVLLVLCAQSSGKEMCVEGQAVGCSADALQGNQLLMLNKHVDKVPRALEEEAQQSEDVDNVKEATNVHKADQMQEDANENQDYYDDYEYDQFDYDQDDE